MKQVLSYLLSALMVSTSVVMSQYHPHFPAFDSLHPHCQVNTTIPMNCNQTRSHILHAVANVTDIVSPPGKYEFKQVENSTIWVTRMNGNGYLTDDILFADFNVTGSENECHIIAQSRSESMGYYDHSVNFCNIYNVFRMGNLTTGTLFDYKCKFPVTEDNYNTTCSQY